MPSFLNKVFSRKKDEKDTSRSSKRTSVQSLLEGKFEAVSPTVSPSATDFLEAGQSRDGDKQRAKEKEREKEKDKDGAFGLFKVRSRTSESKPESSKAAADVPHLTLNLPVPKEKETRALGVVFEADPGDRSTLPDNIIGERRLSPLETLLLVKACSAAIVERGGLETLGVMHPHWYSASPDVQKRLISLFVLSLSPKSPITTHSPTPASPQVIFNTELEYTRDPHDIAAVLRWAIRHLRLEGDSFGRAAGAPWQWYANFVTAERAASYPPNAYSSILVPELPAAHLQLLSATLEIISSLAAHSERNGVSGSKLTKLLGLWLLITPRAEVNDDWASFYARWERAGRALEHIFLAEIRDEMMNKKMPLRLAELVRGYPYIKDGNAVEGDVFPRPRFSSRQLDALFVRIETQLPDHTVPKPAKQHPLRLIADALKAEVNAASDSQQGLWEIIKKAAATSDDGEPIDGTSEAEKGEGYPTLSRVFADETIRFLSLIPAEHSYPSSPGFQLPTSPTIRLSRPAGRRSSSLGPSPTSPANGNGKPAGEHEKAASTPPLSPKDWSDFSSTGFGESTIGRDFAKTLLDSDLERTTPGPVQRKASRGRGRAETAPSIPAPKSDASFHSRSVKSRAVRAELVQLDEAFVDFWSDALLDPISADWPSFVVAQLKPNAGLEAAGKPVEWLVLEQAFTRPPPPPEPQPARASSPRPSTRSNVSASARKSTTFSVARKRFTFFSSSTPTVSGVSEPKSPTFAKKSGMPARISEMGEVLPEEEPRPAAPAAQENSAAVPATVPTSDPPVREEKEELPAIPVVDAQVPISTEGAVAIEPIKTDEEPSEKPTLSLPEEVAVPADTPEVNEAAEEKALPPAPEPVVLAGQTAGPQVALDTSEPAALAEASARVQEEPMELAHEEPEKEDHPAAEVVAALDSQEPTSSEPVAKEPSVPEPVANESAAPESVTELAVQDAAVPEPASEAAPAPEPASEHTLPADSGAADEVAPEPLHEPATSESVDVAVTEAAPVTEEITVDPAHDAAHVAQGDAEASANAEEQTHDVPQDLLPQEREQEATVPPPASEPQAEQADATADTQAPTDDDPEGSHQNGHADEAPAKNVDQHIEPEAAE